MHIWYQPRITVLSVPTFVNPEHLPTRFLGESTPGEQLAEYAGRVCYMSQSNAGNKTTRQYHTHILQQGHGSVLEHGMYSFLLEGVSRALTHELVRHRVGTAISQLSQRYVDASDTAFVCPPLIAPDTPAYQYWLQACGESLARYQDVVRALVQQLTHEGMASTAQRKQVRETARSVLPNCVETKLVWSCNLRALRHVLLLRGSPGADREMQRFALALWRTCEPLAPNVLADVRFQEDEGLVSTLGGGA